MSNIYVEAKGPKGVQAKESLLPTATSGYERGMAVTYGTDAYHATLIAAAASASIGLLEEDAVSTKNPVPVIEFGQAVGQIGASVTALQPLTTSAAGLLVPAQPGQPVTAIALEPQTYVSPGSFACVFVVALLGLTMSGSGVTHATVAGAIPVATGSTGIGSGGALAMTLATPTNAQDGTVIEVFAETAHAHTVTTAANKINGNKLTVTFANVGDSVSLEASGGIWIARNVQGAALS
jgi:hypothetical protein